MSFTVAESLELRAGSETGGGILGLSIPRIESGFALPLRLGVRARVLIRSGTTESLRVLGSNVHAPCLGGAASFTRAHARSVQP